MSRKPSSDELAREYLPLARAMAWKACRKYNLPFDLVVSDALLGLANAVRRCTPGRPFAPYARQTIIGEILRGIRDRVGQRGAYERGEPLAVSVPLDHVGERRLAAADHADTIIESITLWAAVDQLPARERRMIRLRYQHDMSQEQISRRLGCSQMAVSRGLTRAHARLHDTLG